MAKSASSYRLKKTWEVIEHRQKVDNQRFAWKPKSLQGALTDQAQLQLHDAQHEHHGRHSMVHGMSAPNLSQLPTDPHADPDEEEGALIVLAQRRKFKQALKKSGAKYEELEDSLADSRRPPTFRTAAGQVIIAGSFPRSSQRWLGVPPRFGDLPDEKYVGAQANPLSKWISTDKMARLAQEKNPFDMPVRNYVKIDDAIDVKKMQGSHFRFVANPLEEEQELRRGTKERRDSRLLALQQEEEESVSSYTTEEEESSGSEMYSGSDDGTPRVDEAKERKLFQIADAKFQKHVNRLCVAARGDLDHRLAKVESDWRAGAATRPATMRLRR